ncbi:MAG: hypothetical protein LBU65_04405 [Planctomycetaceae bacterium]|jgi:cobalt-zinc-cadmium efflux system membrane fusion protein|nr:hypothetical protein [Planctomycetaceae bacterium]
MKKLLCIVTVFTMLVIVTTGCGKSNGTSTGEHSTTNASGHVIDGWCVEHGVPEKICSRCDPKVVAEFKKNGDWCEEHNRAESQCFICNPDLEEKFIAQYEAQNGKKPPKP